MTASSEKEQWERVRKMIPMGNMTFGSYTTYNFMKDPKRLGFVLARYKFAAKMAGPGPVLELGCGDGQGTHLLAIECGNAMGVDFDETSIADAQRVFESVRCKFWHLDFMDQPSLFGWRNGFKSMVSMDVIEHISPSNISQFWQAAVGNLTPDGVAIIGTPSEISQQFASDISKAGHINIYTPERLLEEAKQHFQRAFLFSMHDEIVHTGFYPLAHYLIVVGVCPK